MELPESFQLSPSNFQTTDFTYDEIDAENEGKLSAVKSANEEKTKESRDILEKIQRRFFHDLIFPRIIVRGINSKRELSSFRISRHQPINVSIDMKEEGRCLGDDDGDASLASTRGEGEESVTAPRGARRPPRQKSRVSEDFQPSDEDEDDEDIEESDHNVDDDEEEEEEEEGGSARKKMGGKKLKCSLSEQQLLVASFSPSEFTLKKPLNPKLLDSRVLKALKKQEERKEKKAARKKQWEELFSRKPVDGEDDPELVKEIEFARRNLGQFTRKTSEAYENTKPTKANDQKKKLIDLLIKVKKRKEDFNEKVLGCQEKKRDLLQTLETLRDQLLLIQIQLKPEQREQVPDLPTLHKDELAKDGFEIDSTEVTQIKSDLRSEEESRYLLSEFSGGSRRSSNNSSLAGGNATTKPALPQQQGQSRGPRSRGLSRQISSLQRQASSLSRNLQSEHRRTIDEGLEPESTPPTLALAVREKRLSKMEKEKNVLAEKRHQHEQDCLLARMKSLVDSFDVYLSALVDERRKVSVELKYAELTMICLYEEQMIIQDTQETEDRLDRSVRQLERNLAEIDAKIAGKDSKLSSSAQTLSRYNDYLRSIHDTVTSELMDNKNVESLIKMFNFRPVKGTANKKVLDKDEEPHCPHFNESVEPVNIDGLREEVSAASVVDPPPTSPPRQGRGRRSTSGRNSSTHGVEVAKFLQQRRQQTLFPQQPIVLPAGVDDEAIEFIQELRKRRDLLESGIKAEEKSLKKISTVLNRLRCHRAHQESLFQEALQELHKFRVEKQSRLNSLYVVVVLHKDQLVLNGIDAYSGQDGDPLLVFSETEWKNLQTRTEQLKAERARHKTKFKEDRQIYLNLQENCRSMREEIGQLESQCSLEMEKRFGEGVTFKDIEAAFADVNRTLEEMKEIAKRNVEKKYRMLERKNNLVKTEQNCLTQMVIENTRLIEAKTNLMQDREVLEKREKCNARRAPKVESNRTLEPERTRELRDLLALYESQQAELYDLQIEVSRFMTKGAPVNLRGSEMSKEERKRKLDQLRRSRIADSRVNQGSNSSPGGGLINLDIAATGVSGVAVAADEEEGRCLTMTASLAQHSILKKKKRRKSIVAVSSSAALDGEKLGMRKTSQAFSFPDDHQILGDEEVMDGPVADERSEREEKVAGTQTQLSEDIEEEEEEEDVDDGDEDAQKTFLIVVEKPAPSNIYE